MKELLSNQTACLVLSYSLSKDSRVFLANDAEKNQVIVVTKEPCVPKLSVNAYHVANSNLYVEEKELLCNLTAFNTAISNDVLLSHMGIKWAYINHGLLFLGNNAHGNIPVNTKLSVIKLQAKGGDIYIPSDKTMETLKKFLDFSGKQKLEEPDEDDIRAQRSRKSAHRKNY